LKTTVAPGVACPGGGTKVEVGLDNGDGGGIASNNVLELGEVDSTGYVCAPAPVAGTYIFRASQGATAVLQRYTIATNTWNVMTSAPGTVTSSLATSGGLVYAALSDNTIRSYNVATDTWAMVSASGGPLASNAGFLRVTPNGLYLCPVGQTTMGRYLAGVWSSFTMPSNCGSGGTYDPSSGKLYIRIYGSNNFMVVDSVTATVGPSGSVTGGHGELNSDGAYYSGNWYTQYSTLAIQRTNATTGGAPTSTGLVPAGSGYSGTAVDFAAGVIYFVSWGDGWGTGFVRYNPVAGTVTNLAATISGIGSQSSIVVVP